MLANLTWDDRRSVTSNTAGVTTIPSALPTAGEGPGRVETGVITDALLAGLASLGLVGILAWWPNSQRCAQHPK